MEQTEKSSWLRLLSFCLAAVVMVALGLSILLAGATVAVALGQGAEPSGDNSSPPSLKTFSGMITDSYCGARHGKDSGKSADECTRACVRDGARYMLVSGDKVYALAGHEPELAVFAGQRVSISGTLDGDTLQVSSAAAGL